MSIKISLDRDALASLFPEGSDGRAHLTRAVASSLIEKLAIKDLKHLDDELQGVVRKVVDESSKVFMERKWGRGDLVPTSRLQAVIEAEVRTAFSNMITQAVKDLWEDKDGILEKKIDSAIAFRLDAGLKNVIRDSIRQVLSEGIR